VVVVENKFLWLFFSLREKAEGFSGEARGKELATSSRWKGAMTVRAASRSRTGGCY